MEPSLRFGSGFVRQTVASHNKPYNFQARVWNEFAVFSRKSVSLFKPLTARNASSGLLYSCNSGGRIYTAGLTHGQTQRPAERAAAGTARITC